MGSCVSITICWHGGVSWLFVLAGAAAMALDDAAESSDASDSEGP
jgi:hypothetical protein